MKFYFFFALFTTLLFSCNTSTADATDKPGDDDKKTAKSGSLEDRARQEITSKMGIDPAEPITIKVYRAHLNGDDQEDAVITLNRLAYAKKDAQASPNGNNKKMYGYMGNYNFFFVYDGQTDQISVPINIASSALSPLRVSFENIQSEAYKDVVVEYRIRNSAFRNYYLHQDGRMSLMFQWKIFDMVGQADYEANAVKFDKGSYSLAKDILIYEGRIKNYSEQIQDVYTYEPTVESTGKLKYRFFYDPKGMKYMTTQLPEQP